MCVLLLNKMNLILSVARHFGAQDHINRSPNLSINTKIILNLHRKGYFILEIAYNLLSLKKN